MLADYEELNSFQTCSVLDLKRITSSAYPRDTQTVGTSNRCVEVALQKLSFSEEITLKFAIYFPLDGTLFPPLNHLRLSLDCTLTAKHTAGDLLVLQ